MSYFCRISAQWPENHAPAVITDEATVSWAGLHERACRAAGWLSSQGVKSGDIVAIRLPRCLAFLELHLGALALGAVTLPMNDRYTEEEVAFLLRDSQARLYVDTSPRAGLDRASPIVPHPIDPDAIAVLCYTSGTTGRPKGALIRHRNLAACVDGLHVAWGWSDKDVLLHALPLYHVHGLFVAQHGALRAGATTVWLPRFSPAAVWEAISRFDVTVFMGVPTFYHRLLAHQGAAPELAQMRLFTSGSAPLPAATWNAFRTRFGFEILERYGMTEVGIVLSNPLHGQRRPGTVGHPLPGVRARIVDGEIQIGGDTVFAGYLGLPEATEAVMVDGWVRTGDLGEQDEDGYFKIAGRKKDLIITGGLNVGPREVESVLLTHPSVDEVAVVGAPDPDLGEVVVATVVGRESPTTELVSHCRNRLSAYKVPRGVRWVEALPRNTMGKVQKSVLRDRWSAVRIRPAASSDLEQVVMWNLALALETEGQALDEEVTKSGVSAVLEGSASAFYLIAEVVDPVGQLLVTREWSDWRNRWVWWLQSIYVTPDWRGRGVLRALHTDVTRRAAAAGVAGLRLYAQQKNATAHAAYERLGMSSDQYRLYEQMFDE